MERYSEPGMSSPLCRHCQHVHMSPVVGPKKKERKNRKVGVESVQIDPGPVFRESLNLKRQRVPCDVRSIVPPHLDQRLSSHTLTHRYTHSPCSVPLKVERRWKKRRGSRTVRAAEAVSVRQRVCGADVYGDGTSHGSRVFPL